MTPERWRRIGEITDSAWQRNSGERTRFLDEACAGDADLRAQVEALLASDENIGEFLALPIMEIAGAGDETELLADADVSGDGFVEAAIARAMEHFPADAGDESAPIGKRIGRYSIAAFIGKGGMGAVYRAVREDDFRMQVAIKLLKRGTDTDAALSRFRTERQILAGLEHPNIARLLDGGATETGLPYFVMEYVAGTPLLEYARHLSMRRRLELFKSLCSAVQYAHQNLIVHRDIKPANVLVTREGIPKLLDFGIAKLLDPAGDEAALTATGMRIMTPDYASPEQVRGEPVSTATDVYSLGAVLYELLTNQRPHHVETWSQSEIEKEICTREPKRPRAVVNNLDPDLDNIVMMALRKDPERRYASVEKFSADLDRFLKDLPVHARRESPAYRGRKFLKRNRVPAITAGLSAVLVLALAAGWMRFANPGSGMEPGVRSVAVLPLENLSGDREQEYFAEGITDALIGELARIPALRVISRTSVMSYKAAGRHLPGIARSLNVGTIAEGSVLRSGSRVRIAVRLVEARKDRPLWSGSYEGELRDVLALQRQVSAAIAAEIGVTLTGLPARPPQARRVNLDAYDAYLKGRHQYFTAFTQESTQKAIALFQQALAIDAGYAPAYAGLADCYFGLSNIYSPPVDVMPKGKWAAQKALELDDTLADGHATVALVKSLYEFDRQGAEKEFQRALELGPSNMLAHLWYAQHLVGMARFDEALAELERARQLDPVSPGTNAYAGLLLYFARRYDQAIQRLQPMVDMDPNYHQPHAFLALVYEQKGEWAKATVEMERAYQLDAEPEALAQLGHVYAVAGRRADARKVLRQLTQLSRRRYVSAYNFAVLYAGLDERDEAFRWLQKVKEDRSEWFAAVNVDPRLDALHSDPRFAGVLQSVGLAH